MTNPSTKPIHFENHHAKRVVEIHFPEGYTVDSADSLAALKRAWQDNLKSWHSPYTCLFDARDFHVAPDQKEAFERLLAFFKNFFMRKIIGFTEGNTADADSGLPFEVIAGYDEAVKQTGLARGGGLSRDLTDLRSRIHIDNDFNAHSMDISFLEETTLATAQDVETMRSKLQNILLLWHSPYNVLINCRNLRFSPEARTAFARVERFLKAFFCKEIVGYSPVDDKDAYPFKTYRSRHLAAGALDAGGLVSGETANCSTRKTR